MNKIFIYGLYEEGNEDIRYIGKTNKENIKKRLNEHICESFRENEITHKRNWIKNVINNGGKINIKNIEIVNEENWEEREKYWISKHTNLTNTTTGGEGGRVVFYTISYDDCKKYVQENLNIKSISQWRKSLIPDNIPKNPKEAYVNRGWISWGDFLGTNRIQDNIKSKNYISYSEAKEWIKNNLKINTLMQWKNFAKENKIPDFIPNRPERFYKKRGWINWGDFLNTGRVANQNKKYIFLSYEEACTFVRNNNIKSETQFQVYNLPINIPTAPYQYYKEWTTWGDFLDTGRLQDNLLSANYLDYENAKKYIKNSLFEIKSERIWKIYVKENKIPNTIPNHPELYYNRKNRGWFGWKDFLSKYVYVSIN